MSILDKMTLFYKNKFYVIILILCVTSFIHLWNPMGFPNIHVDEGTYMFRAMHVLTTGDIDWTTSFYDHPYFGPIFLASILYVINYPSIIAPEIQNDSSIYSAYSIPRIIVGIFAIVDTFLIYGIAKIRYGRNTAIVSSLLFSVMPLTWTLRRIYLESLLLPLILGSILIVLYLKSNKALKLKTSHFLLISSGILLGLSIFTKAPMITMLPLLTLYTYKLNRKITHVILFLVPVLIISLIWPIDAIIEGEFQLWVVGVTSQIERQNESILNSLYDIFLIDPVILSLGLVGTTLAIVKKDSFIILGIIPFIALFSFFISYVNWFYLIPIFGFLCISSGVFLEWIIKRMQKYKLVTILIPVFVIVFGISSTITLISTDTSSFQFEAMSYINTILTRDSQNYIIPEEKPNPQLQVSNKSVKDNGFFLQESKQVKLPENNRTTVIISSPIYSWIYKFIYLYDDTLYSFTENTNIDKGSKVILVIDRYFRDYLTNNLESRNESWNKNLATSTQLYEAFNGLDSSKYFNGSSRNFDFNEYPYTSMRFNLGGSPIEIKSESGL